MIAFQLWHLCIVEVHDWVFSTTRFALNNSPVAWARYRACKAITEELGARNCTGNEREYLFSEMGKLALFTVFVLVAVNPNV